MLGMWSDIRLAVRSLKKSRGFAACVVLLLMLGVAANSTLFSVVDALVLRPLPVRDPERLVRLVTIRPPLPVHGEFVWEEYEAWKTRVAGFEDAIAWSERDMYARTGDVTERVRVHFVSDNFFNVLGTTARAGRLPASEERAASSGIAPVVLSDAYWARRFGRDAGVIGQKITLDGNDVVVIGVTPKGFNGMTVETGPDMRVRSRG